MQIVIFNKDNIVLEVIQSKTVEIKDNILSYENGELRGFNISPLVLADEVNIDVGDTVDTDIRTLDKFNKFIYKDKTKELKEELLATQEALNFLLMANFGGGE